MFKAAADPAASISMPDDNRTYAELVANRNPGVILRVEPTKATLTTRRGMISWTYDEPHFKEELDQMIVYAKRQLSKNLDRR